MKQLIKKIKSITPLNSDEAIKSITSMLTKQTDPIPLLEKELLHALSIKGEYLVLKLSYEDFQDELKYEKIKHQISQSLSVIVSYEEDGHSFAKIEKFVNYICEISDSKQNSIFSIKKVNKLSQFPIKILFTGILPINQLKMYISRDIYELINSDDAYFIARFDEFRDILSQEIGVPILPVFSHLDDSLAPTEAMLIDPLDERVVSHFFTTETMNKNTIENYLVKLFYIYITLANKSAIH